jgi:paraquat-inducible protein A
MEIIGCPDCDLLQNVPELPPGGKARCSRYASTVATRRAEPSALPLALTTIAGIVFIVTNTTPLVSLSAVERFAMTTIGNEAVFATVQQDAKHTATQIADRIADY